MNQPPEGSDLRELRTLLDEIERHLQGLGWDRPFPRGLTVSDMESVMSVLPIRLPGELVEFYSWHDGFGTQARRLPIPWAPISLLDAVQSSVLRRQDAQAAIDSGAEGEIDDLWPQTWLAISGAGPGVTVVCDGLVGDAAPVLWPDWADEAGYPETVFNSFTDLVQAWVDMFESGAYSYDPRTQAAVNVLELRPAKYRLNPAV